MKEEEQEWEEQLWVHQRRGSERRRGGGGSPELLRTLVSRSKTRPGAMARNPTPEAGGNSPQQEEEEVENGENGMELRVEERNREMGGAGWQDGDRDARELGRGPDGQIQEKETENPGGAAEHPTPTPSAKGRSWLKPPNSKQKPVKRRRKRKPKLPKDLTQRTIVVARRRKQEGEEEKTGGSNGGAKDSEEEEWSWGTQEAEG